MSSTRTQSQLCTATLISSHSSVFTFHFGHGLCQSPHWFNRNLSQIITLVAEWIDTYGIHHWKIFRSSYRYRKLAWVGYEPTTTEFHSNILTDLAIRPWVQLCELQVHSDTNLYSYSNFIICSVSNFISTFAFVSHHVFILTEILITWV